MGLRRPDKPCAAAKESMHDTHIALPAPVADPDCSAVAAVRALQTRAERDKTRRFFLDGIRFVSQAVQSRTPLDLVVFAPKLLAGTFARALLRELRRADVPVLSVTPAVYRSLSLADAPQGLGAVAQQQWTPLAEAKPTRGLCWLALDTIQSAGNLGTILRTADAVGAAGLLVIGDAIDPFDPACARAAMGALTAHSLVRTTWEEFEKWKRRTGARLVGTSPQAARDYRALAYARGTILWLGGERKGLTQQQQAACDVVVKIPMVGRSDSLNVAIAASVLLYEVFGQRRKVRP